MEVTEMVIEVSVSHRWQIKWRLQYTIFRCIYLVGFRQIFHVL